MLKRFSKSMMNQYFGKHFPLEYRVYMIFFFESYFISILSAITNTVLRKGLPGIILQWSYIAFCTAMLFVMPRIRLALLKPHLLFITIIYIPFLYFQTAGYHGTALLFALLGFFLLGIVFTGRVRVLMIVLNISVYLACIMISHLYPQLVVPHSGPDAKLIDLIVAFLLSSIGLSILTFYISSLFEDNQKSLAELSLRDALTGVYNRRFLDDCLQDAIDMSCKDKNEFCLLMLDIDHFKKINDTYGHGFGDQVLSECAKAIQSILRSGDIIARYGGEEFVIILFSDAKINYANVAERIRQSISSLRFKNDLTVTVSIGVTKFLTGDTIESLLNRADRGMYNAKKAGRNRIVIEKGV